MAYVIGQANINTTCTSFSGGSDSAGGQGQTTRITFTGTWALGDTYTLIFTDNTNGVQTQVGAGFASGAKPSFVQTYADKVYVLAGPSVYTSSVALPTTFNDPNQTGDGFVTMVNWFSTAENLQAMAPYQGRLAFFTRRSTQIWLVAPLISNWQQVQVLQNIGTMAPASVQPVGDLDVLFLSDSGIRSLKVHDSSLNAYVDDVGAPIDQLVVAGIQSDANYGALACGVVDPASARYMLYLNGVIYVLSYFPSSKVRAWSTYSATYQDSNGVQQPFTPIKFFLYQGQVFTLATVTGGALVVFALGGYSAYASPPLPLNLYDNCQLTATLPFMDAKTPGTWKTSKGVDVVVGGGTWTLQGCMDYVGQAYQPIAQGLTAPTPDGGTLGFSGNGTHFSMKATCSSASRAVISSMIWHYEPGEET